MTEYGQNKPTLLEVISTSAYNKFMDSTYHGEPDKPYNFYDAIDDAVRESKLSSLEMLAEITNDTFVRPEDLGSIFEVDLQDKNWDQLFDHLVRQVISQQVEFKHPEIEEIEMERNAMWRELHWPGLPPSYSD